MFNLGFAVFTVFSILLSITWMQGTAAALWLIVMRLGQGVGGALIYANASAILTDAFPQNERGLALGVNAIAVVVGSFLGLVIGGILAPVSWRLVFLVSVPVGVIGTLWSYHSLREVGVRRQARIDWWGNATFAVGLVLVMIGITYGIQPHGGHTMGWTSPFVVSCLGVGVALLAAFCLIETRVPEPMFHLELFKIRAFTAGNIASLLAAMGRGGLQFILIIWLQGIWLPEHGYAFSQTPLWAGIYMLPLIAGILVAAPTSGYLSDRFGARPFATGGMLIAALSFGLLIALPVSFPYWWFALILFLNGVGQGLFTSPNTAGVMNSLPPSQRGAGAGMLATFTSLGRGALDRRLLLADDRRALRAAALDAPQRPRRARRAAGGRHADLAACRRSRRCSRPSSATTPCRSCSARTSSARCRRIRRTRSRGASSSRS